jgi:hypothetical protein
MVSYGYFLLVFSVIQAVWTLIRAFLFNLDYIKPIIETLQVIYQVSNDATGKHY